MILRKGIKQKTEGNYSSGGDSSVIVEVPHEQIQI